MLAAGGSAQPAPGPGEGAIAVEAGADAANTQQTCSKQQRCDATSRVSLRPAPAASHTSRAALTTGCPSLHAGACALACWWMAFSGRSQHRHHCAEQQGQGQGQGPHSLCGPVDLQEGGERGWNQGWTLWAVLRAQHVCMTCSACASAADAASSRLLSWVRHGWWRGQRHGDLGSRTVPAW
jgi:hypothetical protein